MQSIWKRKKKIPKFCCLGKTHTSLLKLNEAMILLGPGSQTQQPFRAALAGEKCSAGRRLKKNGFAGHSSLFLGRNMMLFIHFNSFKSWIFAEKQHENPIFSIFCLYFSISYSNAGRMFETPALGLEVLHDLHPVTIYLSLESPEYLNSILKMTTKKQLNRLIKLYIN